MSIHEQSITLVIGLGEIGRPLFELLAESSKDHVVGVDVDPVEVKGKVHFLHVCYPFLVKPNFIEVTSKYAQVYQPEIIVVHSTVPVGTSGSLAEKTGKPVVFSPVRGKHTRMKEDMRKYKKFLAADQVEAGETIQKEFERAGMKTARFTSPSALELAKLLETSYFGLLVAWAQEMNRFSRMIDADYLELTSFFSEINYLPPVTFQPGFIGGHCVIPNIQLLKQTFESGMLAAIENSNAQRLAELGSVEGVVRERLSPLEKSKL